MPIIFRKSMRDMAAKLGSTLTAILALTIGLWGGWHLVGVDADHEQRSEREFLPTIPPHVVVLSKDFDKLNLAGLRADQDVFAAELRDKTTLRIEVKPDEWLPVWLFSVGDFERQTLAKIYPQNASFPPPKGTIMIERNGLEISDFTANTPARLQVNHYRLTPVASRLECNSRY